MTVLILAAPIVAIVLAWVIALIGPAPIEQAGRLLMEWGQARREQLRPIPDEVGEAWAPRRVRKQL